MKEKLIIKNFGPIKNVELDLGRFNVLIGDQGTGKSTVAKLLIAIQNTVFRELFNLPENLLQNEKTQLFFEHSKTLAIQNYFYSNSEIYYWNDRYSFEYKNNNVYIKELIELSLAEKISYDFTYIPAERVLVITLADSLYALMETGTSLPKLFLRFGDKFVKARKEQSVFDFRSIIGVKYSHKDNKDIIILPFDKEISIIDSSTGIQGNISLLTVFDSVTNSNGNNFSNFKDVNKQSNYLVIEEPELDCFPETQFKLLKYLVEKLIVQGDFGKNYCKNQLLITTHSPYVLTSLNNMMYAYKVGKLYSEEADKIIEKKYWVNPDDVSVYMMLPNGECEDILDREEGMIRAEKIDSVSRQLNSEFDLLQDIELAVSEDK